eukprot:c7337_g1_i1.p2 GENE.c7337_g1_i1~~c7337_g1_i1.p2  ORF type:complete len:170 (-),score=37.37 c7337_g1_i1:830-1339(-)
MECVLADQKEEVIKFVLQVASADPKAQQQLLRDYSYRAVIGGLVRNHLVRGVVAKVFWTDVGMLVTQKNCTKMCQMFQTKQRRIPFQLELINLRTSPESLPILEKFTKSKAIQLPQVVIGQYTTDNQFEGHLLGGLAWVEEVNDGGLLDPILCGVDCESVLCQGPPTQI